MFRAEKIQEFSLNMYALEKVGMVSKNKFDVSDQVLELEREFNEINKI